MAEKASWIKQCLKGGIKGGAHRAELEHKEPHLGREGRWHLDGEGPQVAISKKVPENIGEKQLKEMVSARLQEQITEGLLCHIKEVRLCTPTKS